MANYSNLAATINAQIRANGVQAITGPVLNAVLTAMVNVLGDGYRLKGVAAPADNPGSPDNRVAYLAAQDGTYTNFGGLTISGEVALLLWDSAWTKEVLFSIDTAVTPGSDSLITSGAVDSALSALATQYMALVPTATEGNLAEFDNAGQVRDAGLATSHLATKDGHYPDLFAGFAGNLVDTRSAGTRQGPFAFRQSGGDGVNYMRKILGRTEAWNQIVPIPNSDASASGNDITLTDNRDGSYTLNGTASNTTFFNVINHIPIPSVSHKYFVHVGAKTNGLGVNFTDLTTGGYNNVTDAAIGIGTWTVAKFTLQIKVASGTVLNNEKIYPFLIDLTLMFGAGNEPSSVAEFEALHPLPYYNYNAGELKNNAATGIKTRGFNQWDEEWEEGAYNTTTGEKSTSSTSFRSKNFIPIIKDASYYINFARTNYANDSEICVLQYDANKSLITYGYYPVAGIKALNSECAFLSFFVLNATTYNNDICINLSDPSRNGIYEPYWKREIVLGLDNLACHDENNNAVVVNGLDGVGSSYDEAVVENGMVTKIIKRFAEVDMGTLGWSYSATYLSFYVQVPNLPAGFNKALLNTKAINSKFATLASSGIDPLTIPDKTMQPYNGYLDQYLVTKDSAYIDAATFKAAVAGVKFRYELATPKVLTLDNPIPALIEVDNLGTEKRLPEDTAADPQAPFECDSNYSVSTANLVRLLNL